MTDHTTVAHPGPAHPTPAPVATAAPEPPVTSRPAFARLLAVAQRIADGTACAACGTRFSAPSIDGGRCTACGSSILAATEAGCVADAAAFLGRRLASTGFGPRDGTA